MMPRFTGATYPSSPHPLPFYSKRVSAATGGGGKCGKTGRAKRAWENRAAALPAREKSISHQEGKLRKGGVRE